MRGDEFGLPTWTPDTRAPHVGTPARDTRVTQPMRVSGPQPYAALPEAGRGSRPAVDWRSAFRIGMAVTLCMFLAAVVLALAAVVLSAVLFSAVTGDPDAQPSPQPGPTISWDETDG